MSALELRVEQPIFERWAVLSDDGRYRYVLGRRWGFEGRRLVWIMLNPSVADAHRDDLTVTKCVGFSQRYGYDELVIVNLYAYRATDPKELADASSIGDENGDYLDQYLIADDPVVAAWGSHPMARRFADWALVVASERPLLCLGVTADGSPRHPSRTPYSASLRPWPVPQPSSPAR